MANIRGYHIRVVPPLEDVNLDADRPTYRQARLYANALRLSYLWDVRDLTSGEDA
ncbi:hypothetical protein [Sphingobium boeckii]|uniref:Uncharacterized protein n=1 Tax=Sphingobium boeckii TaxID=1082345 RepID=A0A7W9EF32_9SPHN|nr:hypothetical protein [Sphingobium boeckii]MBB5685655.1 hypothetical protein [Sphingobium boeckii]